MFENIIGVNWDLKYKKIVCGSAYHWSIETFLRSTTVAILSSSLTPYVWDSDQRAVCLRKTGLSLSLISSSIVSLTSFSRAVLKENCCQYLRLVCLRKLSCSFGPGYNIIINIFKYVLIVIILQFVKIILKKIKKLQRYNTCSKSF